MSLRRRVPRALVTGLATLAVSTWGGAASVAAAAAPSYGRLPMCAGVGKPTTLVVQGGGEFESALFDARGRLLFTDRHRKTLRSIDTPTAEPRLITRVTDPGGLVELPGGDVLMGVGNGPLGLLAPAIGTASLWRVDTATGAHSVYATGLSMANGVARAADGTIYASDGLASSLDRITPDGKVQRAWVKPWSSNGLALSADGATLFVAQTTAQTQILALDTATGKLRRFFARGGLEAFAGLDGLSIDAAGHLYVASQVLGEVWRIAPNGSGCALVRGVRYPAATAVARTGSGFTADSLAVTTFGGRVLLVPGAVPAA